MVSKYLNTITNQPKIYSIGNESLDEILKDSLKPPSFVVIAGHPGAGKTSLALSSCYKNVQLGNKCLYITLQESKEKLLNTARVLGFNLDKFIKEGTVKILPMPMADAIDETFTQIHEVAIKHGYNIVIIDSITALFKMTPNQAQVRSWLQNYIYRLAEFLNGLIIGISEIPFGSQDIYLGDVDFVADALIILKTRIVNRLLERILEIRKARGSPLSIVEFPFEIIEGRGIEILKPSRLSEIAESQIYIKPPCSIMADTLGLLSKTDNIFVTYPVNARPTDIVAVIILSFIMSEFKVLFFSYKYSENVVFNIVDKIAKKLSIDRDTLYSHIYNKVKIVSINPFVYSLNKLQFIEFKIIEEFKPDVVVYHGTEILDEIAKTNPQYLIDYYDKINRFKSKGIMSLVAKSKTDDQLYLYKATIADVIFEFDIEDTPTDRKFVLYLWRRGMRPRKITEKEIDYCIGEIIKNLSKKRGNIL